jgi:hypothetical protein
VDDLQSDRDRNHRLGAEGEVQWGRGVFIVAGMLGVVLVFFVALSALQFGSRDVPEIRGLVPIPAAGTAPQGTATAASTGTPVHFTASVSQFPNVHASPGTDSRIVGPPLQSGSTVNVIGRTSDNAWLQVMLPDGTTGWSSASYLNVSGGIANVPVTQ